jgi:rhodanese-related sulfurtransferase
MALKEEMCSAMEHYIMDAPSDWNTITADQLKKELSGGEQMLILDVREPGELRSGRIGGAVNIPVRELPARVRELPQEKDLKIVTYCASGIRSAYATMFLRVYGYENVRTLAHGVQEWAAAGNKVER